jgi:hypothetical protein
MSTESKTTVEFTISRPDGTYTSFTVTRDAEWEAIAELWRNIRSTVEDATSTAYNAIVTEIRDNRDIVAALPPSPCPVCSFPVRETSHMICMACGTDYAAKPPQKLSRNAFAVLLAYRDEADRLRAESTALTGALRTVRSAVNDSQAEQTVLDTVQALVAAALGETGGTDER